MVLTKKMTMATPLTTGLTSWGRSCFIVQFFDSVKMLYISKWMVTAPLIMVATATVKKITEYLKTFISLSLCYSILSASSISLTFKVSNINTYSPIVTT